MPDTLPPLQEPPRIENRAVRPPGIVPRNVNSWLVIGIALVMVLIIAFSGRSPSTRKPEPPVASDTTVATTAVGKVLIVLTDPSGDRKYSPLPRRRLAPARETM